MEIVRRIVRMNKKPIVGLSIFAVVFSLIMGVQATLANHRSEQNRQHRQQQVASNEALPRNRQHQPAVSTNDGQVSVESSSVAVSRVKVSSTLLEDVQMSSGTDERQCHWVRGGYNSGHDTDGNLKWFHDPANAKICKNNNSPTGWVKVAGGTTGRKCFNPYQPKGHAPGEVAKGKVVMVRSFEELNVQVRAVANVTVRGEEECPDGSTISGRASAQAAASDRVDSRTIAGSPNETEQMRQDMGQEVFSEAVSKAEAKLDLECPEVEAKPAVVEKTEEPVQNVVEEDEEIEDIDQVVVEDEPTPVAVKESDELEPVDVDDEEVAVTGKGEVENLPDTGPGNIAVAFVGASSLSSVLYSVVMRRFGL